MPAVYQGSATSIASKGVILTYTVASGLRAVGSQGDTGMRIALLTTSAMLLASGAAAAQTPPADARTNPASPATQETQPGASEQTADSQTAPSEGLGEIIVTAQRRAENLQRAAVAVDVIAGSDLAAAGITQAGRLGEQVPALTVQPTSTGYLIFVRGVGNFTLTPNSDPAIAFNYDGVYVGRPTSTTGVFYDLERVEVLKGPQGTLYGRNATGGAINVIPTQPQAGKLSAYATVSYGNYDSVIAEGAVNVPLGDEGALRVSGSVSDHDGYLRDGTSDDKTRALRVQLKGKLTPDLTVRTAFDYSRSGGVGTQASYAGNYLFNPFAGGYAFRPSNLPLSEGFFTPAAQAYRATVPVSPAFRLLDPLDFYPFQRNNFYGANAQIDWETGAGTLTIVPAWRYASLNYLSSAGAFGYRQREKDEQYSFEARFTGKRVGIFDYTLGAYYFHERIDLRTALSLSAAANFLVNGFRTESVAPFGRLTAHLGERVRVVGGIRYTDDRKRFFGTTVGNTIVCTRGPVLGCPTTPLFPLVDTQAQIPFPTPAPGGPPVPTFNNGVPTGAIIVRADRNDNSRLKNNRVTYRGALEFDLAPQSLLYGSVETGYRSGGFNPATGFESYEPEYITAFTLGLKNRFFDNRVQLNLEAFWWKYRNQQVSAVRNDLDGRTANITQNIGRSRIRGIEVEARVLATRTTLLSADVQYLDARNRGFRYQQANTGVPPLTGCAYALNAATNLFTVNCSGFQSYNSPRWTVNLAAQQTFELGDYKLVPGIDTQYKTRRYVGFQYLPRQHLSDVWQTNAQLAFGPADDHWSVAVFIRNIENHRTPIYSSVHPLANILIDGTTPPRTFGGRVSAKF